MLHPIPESTARLLLVRARALQDSLFLGLMGLGADHRWADRPAIAAWVGTLPRWRKIPAEVVQRRFGRSNSRWSPWVAVIARASLETKAEMRRVWSNHRRVRALYAASSVAALEMPTWNDGAEWEALKALMASFYDEVLGEGEFSLSAKETLSRSRYCSGFPMLRVCPYWDCGLVNSESQLDHFLPHKTFPFLSVDPDNLVPVSHGPNRGGHKGFKVALDERPPGQPRPATEWFHPRWRSAHGKLDAQVTRLPGAALVVRLAPTTPAYQPHVENLDRLVDLVAYWTQEANGTFRSDQADIGQEVKDYAHVPGTTVETVIRRRIRNHADRRIPRALALLNQRKFECFLADPATRAEIQQQVDEVVAPLSPA